jgi:hypothetical protein
MTYEFAIVQQESYKFYTGLRMDTGYWILDTGLLRTEESARAISRAKETPGTKNVGPGAYNLLWACALIISAQCSDLR